MMQHLEAYVYVGNLISIVYLRLHAQKTSLTNFKVPFQRSFATSSIITIYLTKRRPIPIGISCCPMHFPNLNKFSPFFCCIQNIQACFGLTYIEMNCNKFSHSFACFMCWVYYVDTHTCLASKKVN